MISPSDIPGKHFVHDIHRLRGVAIILVVATHCVSFFTWNQHPFGHILALDLCDDSTVPFMFIAGFLFQHSAPRFAYVPFLKRKLLHIVTPYLLLAIPGIGYALLREPASFFDRLGLAEASALHRIAYMYVYGGIQLDYALWFIPVMCIYFVASPALVQFSRRPMLYAGWVALWAMSLFMHRPTYTHQHNLSLALYFLSAFVGGMFCSQFRDQVGQFIDRHLLAISAITLAEFLGHLLWSEHHGKYVADAPFTFVHGDGLVDWLFLQKLLMTIVLWGVMRRWRDIDLPWLDTLAEASFTIFFMHLYVIFAVQGLLHFAHVEVSAVAFAGLLALALLLPCGVALLTRRTVPRWSRVLVGS